MKMSFRWYGPDDPVTLQQIRQIPMMHGIVSAVYDVPAGEVWPERSIRAIAAAAARHGLAFEVVESLPVHEEIKLNGAGSAGLIDNYCENIRRLAAAGIKVICYNFMPVFDWLRSDLAMQLPDGSTALAYNHAQVTSLDTGTLSLPGWDESYRSDELQRLLERYVAVDGVRLWDHLAIFLGKVIPVCEETGVKLAIHPDDPPWSVFGLPRIITGYDSYTRMREIAPSLSNGITLCTGSLGSSPGNDLPRIAGDFADRVHFVHARNIKRTGGRDFHETAHPTACGSLDMLSILRQLKRSGFDGYIRPDHGRMIWGETGRPGYGLHDRALGAMYLQGLWEGISEDRVT